MSSEAWRFDALTLNSGTTSSGGTNTSNTDSSSDLLGLVLILGLDVLLVSFLLLFLGLSGLVLLALEAIQDAARSGASLLLLLGLFLGVGRGTLAISAFLGLGLATLRSNSSGSCGNVRLVCGESQ